MKISTELIRFEQTVAICSVTVFDSENKGVTVHATAHAHESGRYADLAQARALKLAHQILQHGLDAIQESDFITPPIVDSGQWVVDSDQRSETRGRRPETNYQSPVTSYQSPTTSDQSPATSHQLPTLLDSAPAPISQLPTIKETTSDQPPASSRQTPVSNPQSPVPNPQSPPDTLLIDTPSPPQPDFPSFPTTTDPDLALSNQPTVHIPDYQPPTIADQPPTTDDRLPAPSPQPPATNPPDPEDFLDIPW